MRTFTFCRYFLKDSKACLELFQKEGSKAQRSSREAAYNYSGKVPESSILFQKKL